jgi:hypothetical protein
MSISSVAARLDYLLSGGPWWRYLLARADSHLERAKQTEKLLPFAVIAAQDKVHRAQFAHEYGRPAKPEIRDAVERAKRAGIPTKLLRLVVLNLDIQINQDGKPIVRQNWWLTTLAALMRVVVVAVAAIAALQILTSALPVTTKMLLLVMYSTIFFTGAYVWDLFGTRAVRATRLLAQALKHLPEPDVSRGAMFVLQGETGIKGALNES